jgi:hypothetical protein
LIDNSLIERVNFALPLVLVRAIYLVSILNG